MDSVGFNLINSRSVSPRKPIQHRWLTFMSHRNDLSNLFAILIQNWIKHFNSNYFNFYQCRNPRLSCNEHDSAWWLRPVSFFKNFLKIRIEKEKLWFFKFYFFLRMTEVRKRTGKKEEKSIKSEKSNVPENDSKSKIVQIGKIQSNVSCVEN